MSRAVSSRHLESIAVLSMKNGCRPVWQARPEQLVATCWLTTMPSPPPNAFRRAVHRRIASAAFRGKRDGARPIRQRRIFVLWQRRWFELADTDQKKRPATASFETQPHLSCVICLGRLVYWNRRYLNSRHTTARPASNITSSRTPSASSFFLTWLLSFCMPMYPYTCVCLACSLSIE